jgi:hypothetical protein
LSSIFIQRIKVTEGLEKERRFFQIIVKSIFIQRIKVTKGLEKTKIIFSRELQNI